MYISRKAEGLMMMDLVQWLSIRLWKKKVDPEASTITKHFWRFSFSREAMDVS